MSEESANPEAPASKPARFDLLESYIEGQQAARGGIPYVENPYPKDSNSRESWGLGWDEVTNERKARDQEFLNDFVPRRRLSVAPLAGVTAWLRESDTIRLVTFEFSLRRRLRRLRQERCILEQQIEHATAKRDRNRSDAYKERDRGNISPNVAERRAGTMRLEIVVNLWEGEFKNREDALHRELTEFLLGEADRYLIPPPTEDDLWKTPDVRLSIKGIHYIRSVLRKELQERNALWQSRVALSIGLLGSLIGLVTVLASGHGALPK